MNKDFVITEPEIKTRVEELAKKISLDHKDKELVVIGLLTGSFIFISDLIRYFHSSGLTAIIDFMDVSSYGGETETSGLVRIGRDVEAEIKGRSVLLVDDIVDSGYTLSTITGHLKLKEPSGIRTCVLLDKPSRRKVDVKVDYVGFKVPDLFIVGYGLDFDGRYRELPYITAIEP
ncbi:hypoxanthine phosphoribosyltransferase [candidate division KSB1 bacterium]|nr:MAG: hypoxanthine phosphoribosyltransferase [candidate division KSB1 bacterium]